MPNRSSSASVWMGDRPSRQQGIFGVPPCRESFTPDPRSLLKLPNTSAVRIDLHPGKRSFYDDSIERRFPEISFSKNVRTFASGSIMSPSRRLKAAPASGMGSVTGQLPTFDKRLERRGYLASDHQPGKRRADTTGTDSIFPTAEVSISGPCWGNRITCGAFHCARRLVLSSSRCSSFAKRCFNSVFSASRRFSSSVSR